ncbi:hemicentin-2-like isoform X2 [Biomphalaria glabrata]|nr:hemicentin-2-like isoform X2 [Biomphalaria glabrata]
MPISITCSLITNNSEASLIITTYVGLKDKDFKSEVTKETLPKDLFRINMTISKPSASQGDSADYLCSEEKYHNTVVQNYEVYAVFTQGANVTEGHETSIRCDPTLNHDFTLAWYKDNVPLQSIPGLQDRLILSKDNKTVSFKDARPSDGGVYTCRIMLQHNTSKQVLEEKIFLHAKPFILPGALTNVTSTSLILTCPVGGYPSPEIFWQRGKDILTANGNVQMTTVVGTRHAQLVITNLTDNDYGTYSCIADNWLGKAELTYQVHSDGHRSKAGLGYLLLLCGFKMFLMVKT